MLLSALGLAEQSRWLTEAVETALREGCRTRDLGGETSCSLFGARVRAILEERLAPRAARPRMSLNYGRGK